MKFKYGDHVSFLNDTGGGTVNRIDSQGVVFVLTEDGFEIPVKEKELVHADIFTPSATHDDVEMKKTTNSRNLQPENNKPEHTETTAPIPQNIPHNAPVHLVLGFIPEEAGPVFTSPLACYLINDSPLLVYFLAGKKEGGILQYLASGIIEADTKSYVATFDQTTISKLSDIHIQLIFVSKGRYYHRNPIDKMINLNLVNFSKESYYRNNDYFDEKAVLFDLVGEQQTEIPGKLRIPDNIKEIKDDVDQVLVTGKKKKKEPTVDTLEVDLHLNEDDLKNSQLTPAAILALQMSRFHAGIEEAISKNLRRVVIIHGLGQGTLKLQIRKELQDKYPQYIFQDASFKEYGFGATMVHLTYHTKQ